MRTRWKNCKVVLSEMSSEFPIVCTIKGIKSDAGILFYECETEDGAELFIALTSVYWVSPKSSRVINIKKKLKLVK